MLRKKTFQNKVAASRYSLPITATLATLVWVAVGLLVSNIWVEFAFTAMSTLLMVELNNRNASCVPTAEWYLAVFWHY